MTKETTLYPIQQITDWIASIADIARRHGQNDFPACSGTGENGATASASLCGLTVYFNGGDIARIKTHDMDLRLSCCDCRSAPQPLPSFAPDASFHTGSLAHLAAWHARLHQLASFFGGSPQASLAQAA